MASGYEDFIFEEDFDAIIAVLEEDESLEGQFHEAVQEVLTMMKDIAPFVYLLFFMKPDSVRSQSKCRWETHYKKKSPTTQQN